MDKDLKQIQEYNRRKIFTNYYNSINQFDKDDIEDLVVYCVKSEEKINLNIVLLALNCVLYDAYISEECYYSGKEGNYLRFDIEASGSLKTICWDLTKPTLEEQDHEVQMAIYKLLGGE